MLKFCCEHVEPGHACHAMLLKTTGLTGRLVAASSLPSEDLSEPPQALQAPHSAPRSGFESATKLQEIQTEHDRTHRKAMSSNHVKRTLRQTAPSTPGPDLQARSQLLGVVRILQLLEVRSQRRGRKALGHIMALCHEKRRVDVHLKMKLSKAKRCLPKQIEKSDFKRCKRHSVPRFSSINLLSIQLCAQCVSPGEIQWPAPCR